MEKTETGMLETENLVEVATLLSYSKKEIIIIIIKKGMQLK